MKNTRHSGHGRQAPEASIPTFPSRTAELEFPPTSFRGPALCLGLGLCPAPSLSPGTASSGDTTGPADLGLGKPLSCSQSPGCQPRHQSHWLNSAVSFMADALCSRAAGPVKCIQVPSPGKQCHTASPRFGATSMPTPTPAWRDGPRQRGPVASTHQGAGRRRGKSYGPCDLGLNPGLAIPSYVTLDQRGPL